MAADEGVWEKAKGNGTSKPRIRFLKETILELRPQSKRKLD
jgi:hypothetical protein